MSEFPETRDSLLVQVRDPGNRDAWERFASIYRPVIVRIAVARGLQHADAQDLSQQVLMAVAGAVGDWEKRDESTKFRHWLSRVTKNAILNALLRTPRDQAAGGSSVENLLQEIVDPDGATTALIETEWRNVLEYFSSATQIGLTATPKETKDVSNIEYFGDPIYTYSLKQGISDGFLAPYKVVRIGIDKDLDGWRPEIGQNAA